MSTGDETPNVGRPDGEGLPGDPMAGRDRAGDHLPTDPAAGAGRDGGGPLNAWRRSYGASPLHLVLHLAAIVLIAWALSQSFDAKYSKAYVNLAIWMVGGAILNDFVALPLYVGIDRLARAVSGAVRGRLPGAAVTRSASVAEGTAAGDTTTGRDATTPRVRGNGHVRVPVVMSAVLLLVYFPNIMHKAPIGHRLSTGLAEQPDWAARWLAITAGLLLASAAIYVVRLALARRRASAAAA